MLVRLVTGSRAQAEKPKYVADIFRKNLSSLWSRELWTLWTLRLWRDSELQNFARQGTALNWPSWSRGIEFSDIQQSLAEWKTLLLCSEHVTVNLGMPASGIANIEGIAIWDWFSCARSEVTVRTQFALVYECHLSPVRHLFFQPWFFHMLPPHAPKSTFCDGYLMYKCFWVKHQ